MENLVHVVISVYTFVVRRHSGYNQSLQGVFLLVLLCPVSGTAWAGSIAFDLRDSAAALALDNQVTGQLSQAGLSASLRVGSEGAIRGVFNQTSAHFGINNLDTSDDRSSLIDTADAIAEAVIISFNRFVLLERLVLSAFAPGEIAGLRVAGATVIYLYGQSSASDYYHFSDVPIAADEALVLSHVSGNGFSLDSFTVRPLSVSEPGILVLILAPLVILALARHRMA